MTTLHYGGEFWEEKLGSSKDFDLEEKLHLIFSLIVFLGVTLEAHLNFIFSSKIDVVVSRVASFFRTGGKAFAPETVLDLWFTRYHDSMKQPKIRARLDAMIQPHACRVVLNESNKLIRDSQLKVTTTSITLTHLKDLLRPEYLQAKYRKTAPFTWRLLETFTASPNKSRRRKAMRKSAAENNTAAKDNLQFDSDNAYASDSEENTDEEAPSENSIETDADGFSRKPLLAITVAISSMLFVRNRATNFLPFVLGLFFKTNGTSSRVLTMLSNAGISVSEQSVECTKKTLSDEAIDFAAGLTQSVTELFYVIFDNVNIYQRKFQQRITNQQSMLNITNSAVIGIDTDGIKEEAADAMNLDVFLGLRGERSKANFKIDIMPTKEDDRCIDRAATNLISQFIVRYCPGSKEWAGQRKMLESLQAEMPRERRIPVKKTDARPFGVFDVNEGSKKGIVGVLEAIMERTTMKWMEWSSCVRIMVGDWLTSSNIRAARHERDGDINRYTRMEYVRELSALWHVALQATHMLIRAHLGTDSQQDPSSLNVHKTILKRKWDPKKPNYAAAKSLIRHSLIARILHIIMVHKGWTRWSQLQSWRPNLKEIREVATHVYDKFATTEAAKKAKDKKDDFLAHSIYFIRDALLFCVFEDATAHAEAGMVLRVLRYWCLAFRGVGQHNYARECAEILLTWKYETPEHLRPVLERSWFINRWGKEGRWIPSDLWLEQQNYWVKRVFIAEGSNVTAKYIIEKGSACVEAFRDVSHRVANFFGDRDLARRSKEVTFQEDMRVLVEHLEKENLHKWKSTIEHFIPSRAKKATPLDSAIVDVYEKGAAEWSNGKFDKFLSNTAYDREVGRYQEGTDNNSDDGSDIDLQVDTYNDLHGDEDGATGALGGGSEFATGDEVDEL